MSSLAVFPAPESQESPTLREYNSTFITGHQTRSKESNLYIFGQDSRYDEILATENPSRIPTNLARDVLESPFLPVEETVIQKLYRIWVSSGFTGVLEDISDLKNEVPPFVSHISRNINKLVQWVEKTYTKLVYIKLRKESLEMPSIKLSGPVITFAWHPHSTKFAVGLKDDSVRIFSFKRGLTKLLNHRLQKVVSCCAWSPLSCSILAVGCQNGIIIWNVDPQSSAIRLAASSVQHLYHPGHTYITSLSWSPGGRLLVSGSAINSVMMVWDVTMVSCTALHRIGGPLSFLLWSPCETKIFTAAQSSIIRVWETQRWTCETWTNLTSKCQVACWSPDGRVLVFSLAKDKSLYYLRFCEPVGKTGMENFDIGGSRMAVKCADLSEYTFEVNGRNISIGGYVKSMTWDPTGERLAIILKDDEGNSQNYIPVFKTRLRDIFELVPSGFIHGLVSDGEPQLIAFQNNFKHGALLSIVWLSGKVTFIPMLFTPRAHLESQTSRVNAYNQEVINTNELYSTINHVESKP